MGPEYLNRLQTVDLVPEVPKGWTINSRSAFALPIVCELNYPPLEQVVEFELERRWNEETGLKAQESHFTIIVPIRNEENLLPSFLGALMLSEIPSATHINFLFITNACDTGDRSINIIKEFIDDMGNASLEEFTDQELEAFKDPKLEREYRTAQLNNLRFMHLNTQTAGKPNVLNIGNELALQNRHEIAICIDANNFVEPGALRTLFAEAYNSICRYQDGTAVLSGSHKTAVKPTRLKPLYNLAKAHMEGVGRKKDIEVSGCLMAWDTLWLKENGGVPSVVCDDYAIGVYARRTGRKIRCAENAAIWGYDANNLKDRVDGYARAVRGRLQMLDIDPNLRNIIEEDFHLMRDFPNRMSALLGWIRANPKRGPFIALKFLMWEYARIKGRREYEKDPTNQSWTGTPSTT